MVGFTGDSSGLGGFGGCGVLAWVSLVVGDFSWGGGHKLALSLVSQLTRVRFPRGCSSCFCEMDFLVLVGVSLVLGDFSWGNWGVWTFRESKLPLFFQFGASFMSYECFITYSFNFGVKF